MPPCSTVTHKALSRDLEQAVLNAGVVAENATKPSLIALIVHALRDIAPISRNYLGEDDLL